MSYLSLQLWAAAISVAIMKAKFMTVTEVENTTQRFTKAPQVSIAEANLDRVALVGERLSLPAFNQLAGTMAGYAFVKIVVERETRQVHFINNERYVFHADYIAERIMGIPRAELRTKIDEFNKKVYLSPDRPYYLGILSLHQQSGAAVREVSPFFAIETVEVDNMNGEMLVDFFNLVKGQLDQSLALVLKPANHFQEGIVQEIDPQVLPRMFSYELFTTKDYVPLNAGQAVGRLRIFESDAEYRRASGSIKWYDIIVMDRVPDDIPRISGIVNARHTTPLSHTNVLATGWQIPNAVEIGVKERLVKEGLADSWVTYTVDLKAEHISFVKTERPEGTDEKPRWSLQQIRIEEPETRDTKIVPLTALRTTDRFRYGTKAANLGELVRILEVGSPRLLGYYKVPRPPRQNLTSYLADYLGLANDGTLAEKTWSFLKSAIEVPRGIAIPFSVQQAFLESSPKIQQAIGKLKMALELNAKEIDSLCIELMRLIRQARMPHDIRDAIDVEITEHLSGVRSFVVRSSSNAEDLKDFSAAGIYESINHVTTADRIFESIKEVWASLVSPRSVRLRQDVGISLDHSYMGVIIQEEVQSDMGGVLVTTNPMNVAGDFRNVYINASSSSAIEVVSGQTLPYQYLFNTVEGGGRTLSIGSASKDLDSSKKARMQKLAFAGRLLQSHFAQDYSFSSPADIEWAAIGDRIFVLQLRPYTV